MDERTVDVVVVGTGPGGEALATRLAGAGLDVVAVERHLVGGECPYYACIPTKMMVRAADSLAEARRAAGLAGAVEVEPDWARVHARIRDEATAGWDDTLAVERFDAAGVTFLRGTGRLAGPRRVEVEPAGGGSPQAYVARRGVVLNTGTSPAVPPLAGLDGTPYWTNREAVRAARAPESLLVLGVGAVGAEMGQAFARFGTAVTVVESADRILAVEEPEAGHLVGEVFAREGIRVLTGSQAAAVAHADGRFALDVGDERLVAERLLVATGRRPNLVDLGLDTVGLDPQARSLEVDARMRAGDGLWAIGDITGKGAFTHVSMYQAAVAARDIVGEDGPPARYHAVPRVTFTDPEVGSVGLTERQARDAGLAVQVATTDLASSTRGWIARDEGFVKLVADADRGVLVGATTVGRLGGEVLSMLATAVHAEVPVATLRSMVYAYPTYHRAVETALADLG